MELNVLDFPSPAAALAAARHGDKVYFPGSIGECDAPAAGYAVARSIEVCGDGIGPPGTTGGTTLVPAGDASGNDVVVIQSGLERVRLRDFKITKRTDGPNPDGDTGVRCQATTEQKIGALVMERVAVLNMRLAAVVVEGTDLDDGAVGSLLMVANHANGSDGVGMTLRNIVRAAVVQSGASTNAGDGWVVDRCAIAFYQSTMDGHPDLSKLEGHMRLTACRVAIVDAGHFENFGHFPQGCLIEGLEGMRGGVAWVGGCVFGQPDPPKEDVAGVRVADSFEGSVVIAPNNHTRVANLVDLQVAAGNTVTPQFTNPNVNPPGQKVAGQIAVVAGALVASTSINRLTPLNPSPVYSGLIVPSLDADPTWAVQNGMIYYDSNMNRFRVRIANAWKTISLVVEP